MTLAPSCTLRRLIWHRTRCCAGTERQRRCCDRSGAPQRPPRCRRAAAAQGSDLLQSQAIEFLRQYCVCLMHGSSSGSACKCVTTCMCHGLDKCLLRCAGAQPWLHAYAATKRPCGIQHLAPHCSRSPWRRRHDDATEGHASRTAPASAPMLTVSPHIHTTPDIHHAGAWRRGPGPRISITYIPETWFCWDTCPAHVCRSTVRVAAG